ncbi:hypothetical protein PoB_000765800 [Plakobranchus ocellatus]|uniref:Uncharacterized protein n=1 Tax=Plakobranchus ocellatus TaxID=259542 RepID=A0AAV3YFA5_9GAST|nr:hypothetical protein PoB_000765800 [Plakobranchus ocellatus]
MNTLNRKITSILFLEKEEKVQVDVLRPASCKMNDRQVSLLSDGGVGCTVASESALRSAGTPLSQVRALPLDRGSESHVVDWLYTKTQPLGDSSHCAVSLFIISKKEKLSGMLGAHHLQ